MNMGVTVGPMLLPGLLTLLPEAAQNELRLAGRNRAFRRNEVLIHEGYLATEAYFLHAGWTVYSMGGAATALMGPGDGACFGLSREPVRAPGTLQAITAGSAAVVPLDTLREQMLRYPEQMLELFDLALRRFNDMLAMHVRLSVGPLEVRLAHLLWRIAEPLRDGQRRIPAGIAQSDYASLLGAAREEVSRKRNLLVKAGYLYERDGQWYLDPSTPLLLVSTGQDI